jgi:hypothetical protein
VLHNALIMHDLIATVNYALSGADDALWNKMCEIMHYLVDNAESVYDLDPWENCVLFMKYEENFDSSRIVLR